MKKNKIGQLGEEIAVNLLVKKGYKIIERNFKNKFGEIDIIAKIGEKIIFIEVKSINAYSSFSPEENFHSKKIKRIKKSIEIYKNFKNIQDFRVDLITVKIDFKHRKARIKHFLGVI